MSYNPQPSQQRGVASDPRHGKARGEVIEDAKGASPLRQVTMVISILAAVGAAFLLLGILLTEDANRAPWLVYTAYGVLALAVLLVAFLGARRRRKRQSLDDALRGRRSDNGRPVV